MTLIAPGRAVLARTEEMAKPIVRWGLGHAIPRGLVTRAARKGDLQSRLITEARTRDTASLAPLMTQIRDRGQVIGSPLGYMTTHHAVVREVLTSNDFRTGFVTNEQSRVTRALTWAARRQMHPIEPPSLLVTEPPDHTFYRKLVTKVFTARAVERLRGRTQAIADDLLDALPAGEPVDLVERYCALLPVNVIAEVLGVPEADRPRVLELGGYAAASLDMGLSWSTFRTVETALNEFDDWLGFHLGRLRENPGDDLFSQLVHASEGGRVLTEQELKATAGLVLAAGFETTVNLLSNGIKLLGDHPDQLARLQAEPELWLNAVDETLRIDPPVLMTSRSTLRDTTVGGRSIGVDSAVIAVLAGANRDPKVFPDPDRYDVARPNARDHLSFSAGRHFCLGAALARMEGEVGLRSLHERFDVELLPGARRRGTRVLRGFEYLPARLRNR
ncbi:cytochrome P450 [Calidifontibacter sp. DB0510]|uniref:Cytochrome P450 n=1 Tax=Metallococcus carri TaxID=1656884 RepID=A0A967EBH3_9MICO|nr:cytochrome P450 [Metallococcus carri]NHN57315.1 cytochrome P450 [Metallococcus carri]NOP38080.1 cytochrome P450 [Calidifontibacter sp. DB2511S]